MADTFFDFVQKVKDHNPIEDVAAELGFKFERGSGRYRKVPHSGGLIVNVGKQRFFHATGGTNGDVIDLVRMAKGFEPRTAMEWLARRANIEIPNWGRLSDEEIKAQRLRVNVFAIAQRLFQGWLWEDAAALEYVRGRGFTDEVICSDVTAEEALDPDAPFRFSDETIGIAREYMKKGMKDEVVVSGAGFGFSGRRTDSQVREMKGEFDLHGVAHDHPLAVAILGFEGDVREWAKKWGIDMLSDDWNEDWETWGRIHGMMLAPGIVFAHTWAGQTNYLSRRQMPGHDRIGDREWKSFNVPKILAGPRHPYFNHVFRSDAEDCVIVEGVFDAESWGQWGMAAVALCGVSVEDEGMSVVKSRVKRVKRLCIGLDADEAGMKKRENVAAFFGATTRLLDYSSIEAA